MTKELTYEIMQNLAFVPDAFFEEVLALVNRTFSKYDPNSSLKESLKAWRSSYAETDDSNEAVDTFLGSIHSDELYTPKENLFYYR